MSQNRDTQPCAVIEAVDPDLVASELTDELFLRHTNKGGNQIYTFDAVQAPHAMREVGRLREIAFRAAGGGTGTACDIDPYDLMTPVPCRQLVVWDPETRQILGGYRYITGKDVQREADGSPRIATGHMFRFSDRFMADYLPHTLELGRSFVRTEYQSSRAGAKAIYALDNLWDGLGALTVVHPEVKYLFGKVTMYPGYLPECRNLILYFLQKYFPDPEGLVRPIEPLETGIDPAEMQRVFGPGRDFGRDYRILNGCIRAHGVNIPPLVNAYMSLSPSMHMCGTAINHDFGEVEETAILLTIDEIYDAKKQRHIESFNS